MGLQFFFNIKKREKSQNVTNRDKKTNILFDFWNKTKVQIVYLYDKPLNRICTF